MLNLYHLEKKKIIESYERRKPFFVGELQQSVRREYTYDFEEIEYLVKKMTT